MQINVTDESRIPRPKKPLENNSILIITRHLGDFIDIIRKKAAMIMYSVLLMIIVAGCGGGEGYSVSSTSGGTTGDPGGTNVTGNSAGSAGYTGTITGSATLAWNPPTTNTDGTPITNLAGYKIYYGTTSGNYTSVLDVGNVTTYTVANLSSGTYYFAVTSYDIYRIESDYSNEASKTIP